MGNLKILIKALSHAKKNDIDTIQAKSIYTFELKQREKDHEAKIQAKYSNSQKQSQK